MKVSCLISENKMNNIINRLTQKGSPFELQDTVIKGIPCKIFPHGPKTLQEVFIKAASFRQNEFIVHGDSRFTFSQVIEHAKYFASSIQQQYRIQKGDRITLLMQNSYEWVIAFIAIQMAGAVSVIMHADTEKATVTNAIELTSCRLIITDQDNIKKLNTVDSDYSIILISNKSEYPQNVASGDKNISCFVLPDVASNEDASQIFKFSKSDPDDEALISFTSGTTGTPKRVVLSHRNMTTGIMNMMLGGFMMNYRTPKTDRHSNGSNNQPCSLLLSPLSHIGGYSQILLMCYLGGKIVLMNEWESNKAATLIEKEKVRSINGASVDMIRELLRSDNAICRLKTLTNLNIHGTALNQNFLKEIGNSFPSISIGTSYGMTETCGSISNVSGYELLKNPDSAGTVLPSVDIKIINDTGQTLLPEETGEICIRGAMVMMGYCSDTNETGNSLDRGWLRTGDLGYLNSERTLYVKERIKDIINCGIHTVSARELELAAYNNPQVDEVVALAFPSSDKCENIVLAVLPKKTENIDEQSLKQELYHITYNYLEKIKFIIVDSLPRTASGKVSRNELKKRITSAAYFKLFDEENLSTLM